MGVRDALLLNLTGSNFEALQTNDTARLKGDLSLQKDDGTEVLGVDVSAATLNLSGGITGSGNISSSLSSTARLDESWLQHFMEMEVLLKMIYQEV